MDNLKFIQRIKKSYEKKDYRTTLQYLDEYFGAKNFGIYDELLDIYINCQINLGMLENASKNINLMKNLFPNFYTKSDLIIKYIVCRKTNEAKKMLPKIHYALDYYYIAKKCFLWGLYAEAEQLFTHFLSISYDPFKKQSTKEYLRKIKQYRINPNVFHETDYLHFKLSGQKLEPGHIIYTEKLLDIYKENVSNTDSKKENRPYMIWKVIDDKIYAFPVSSKADNQSTYILYHQKYPNYTYDREIKSNLVCIEEKDVERLMDKVTDEDYNTIIHNLYHLISLMHDIPKQSTKFFMDTMTKELGIKKHDVISINDFNSKSKKLYFIIDIDNKKKKYKVVEIKFKDKETTELVDGQLKNINMSTPILYTVNLDEQQKSRLINKIPNNYMDTKMIGTIVDYNSKKLEIMIEEDNYYICLDKTFNCSASYIAIELIKKDIPLFIVERVDKDSYKRQLETLKAYLKKNIYEVHQKRIALFNSK